jgi:hypothetical protein
MAVFPMVGVMELLLIVLLGNGIGLPLGVPPREPDPMLARVAPEECLYYTTWAGMAEPAADSQNATERLLAEPEVRLFARELESVLRRVFGEAVERGAPDATRLGQQVPSLIKSLITHPTVLYVERIAPSPDALDARGALVVALGDEAEAVRDTLTALTRRVPEDRLERIELAGSACVRMRLGGGAPPVTFGFHDHYLIVAVGDESFEGVLERAQTPAPMWLQEATNSLPVPRVSTLSYMNLSALREMATSLAGPPAEQLIGALGLSTLTHAVSVCGMDETGLVSRSKVFLDQNDRGLVSLLVGEPLVADDLRGIPRDATVAFATRLDLRRLLRGGLDLLREMEPRAAAEIDQGIRRVEQRLGIELEQGLLQSLGDVWTLHAAPTGGGLLAGWTLAVSVRDRQQLEFMHQKLLPLLQTLLADGMNGGAVRTFVHQGVTAYTLRIPGERIPFAPSWCITDSQLVITLLPQTLKAYLSQAPFAESLAEQDDVARLFTDQPGPSAIAYQDTRGHVVTFYPWLQYMAQVMSKQLAEQGIQMNASTLPSLAAIAPHLRPTVSAVLKSDDGVELRTHHTLPGVSLGSSAPVLAALLAPAVQRSRGAARRAQSMNNLKQIGLAMHNYHDVMNAFPAAHSVDAEGNPLLSWRVHILPFIEQQPLYERFHLDEPWDSEHNRQLIAHMPETYRAANSLAEPGKTVYLGNAAADGILETPRGAGANVKWPRGISIREIRDGTSNTILAVEASDSAAVIWTKPDDLVPDPDNPVKSLLGLRPDGFLAVFCDGSVRLIQASIDRQVLNALFTRSGGEVVQHDDW